MVRYRCSWLAKRMGAHTLTLLNAYSRLIPRLNSQRALFSLFFALLVAIAEGVLFILWNSKRSMPKSSRGRLRRKPRTQGADVKIKVE